MNTKRPDPDNSLPVECANCEWTGTTGETRRIRNVWERVAPGEEMPAGECPKCGALAHLVPFLHADEGGK